LGVDDQHKLYEGIGLVREIARRMRAKGIDPAIIADVTGVRA